MSAAKPSTVDYSQQDPNPAFIPRPVIHSGQDAGWKNIHFAHYQFPSLDFPEAISLQHIICVPSRTQLTEVELVIDGKRHKFQHNPQEKGLIEMMPAYVPLKVQSNQGGGASQCYLDPTFLAHAAYESANPEQVELKSIVSVPDPLICQIVLALRTVVETDATNSCFYAESMATALAAHLLRNYSTRKHVLREYEDGLPKYKLKQALEYMNAHLSENVSLATLSDELQMSQFHFCRLFKQTTGIAPHAYLIQQRVERSKQLLKQSNWTISDIAIECGFANPSHFAKHFRRYTGISPKQFRMM